MAAESLSPSESAARAFALFGLEPQFELDRAKLEDLLRQASLAWHPDRFAAYGQDQVEEAEQKMAEFNEAFARLANPVRRAELLLHWLGAPPTQATDHQASPEFLMQMMELREAAEDAQAQYRDRPQAAKTLLAELAQTEQSLLQKFAARFAELDLPQPDPNAIEELQRIYYEHRYHMRTRERLAEAVADSPHSP